jgi:hypothetical protein
VKAKLLRLLSVVGLILAALASLDLTGITAVLPPEYAGKALAGGLAIAALPDAVLMSGADTRRIMLNRCSDRGRDQGGRR